MVGIMEICAGPSTALLHYCLLKEHHRHFRRRLKTGHARSQQQRSPGEMIQIFRASPGSRNAHRTRVSRQLTSLWALAEWRKGNTPYIYTNGRSVNHARAQAAILILDLRATAIPMGIIHITVGTSQPGSERSRHRCAVGHDNTANVICGTTVYLR